jgi:hypothetical protein
LAYWDSAPDHHPVGVVLALTVEAEPERGRPSGGLFCLRDHFGAKIATSKTYYRRVRFRQQPVSDSTSENADLPSGFR